jgi:menaquinone-dependent protoporphyrinogen oxidase
MNVLVCVASKHHATAEIGARIRDVLVRDVPGARVDLRSPQDVATVDEYDAAVIGSAVYLGRWLHAAHAFVGRHAAELSRRPVWLFSSGPVGTPDTPGEGPVDAASLRATVKARDHRVFGGRVDRQDLNLWERSIVGALKVPDGDVRDWAAVEDWATGVAAELRAATP